MSVEIRDDLPGIAEASAELERLMASDQAAAEAKPEDSASPSQTGPDGSRAAQTQEDDTQGQSTDAGAPATAEKAKVDDKAKLDKDGKSVKAGTPSQEQSQSRFAKERERQNKSWGELNTQKEALKRERDEFERQRQEYQAELDKAEEGFSAETYEEAAKKFEEAGKLDLAEAARAKAKQLREHPDPKAQARKTRLEAAKKKTEDQTKEWALKAGVDFPELAKDKSPLQMRVAQLFQEEPDLKAHPKGIYVAARIANLEAAAASVPGKDKELAQLRAKVSELEKLTSPGGEGGPTNLPGEKPFEQMSGDEQLAQLEQDALQLGSMR